MKHLDRYRGCLLGGAAGDALGYPVEFLSLTDIQEQYGPAGITSYTLQNGVAQISDDTQMTLFTANGLLFSETRRRIGAPGGGSVAGAVAACYRDWLKTQRPSGWEETGRAADGSRVSWLLDVPELYSRRAPGNQNVMPCRTLLLLAGLAGKYGELRDVWVSKNPNGRQTFFGCVERTAETDRSGQVRAILCDMSEFLVMPYLHCNGEQRMWRYRRTSGIFVQNE